MSRPLVIAHRGASGHEVENSLAAFRAAGALGADAVELDVHATADGALVVHHDEMVDTTHHIAHATAKQVQQLRLPNGEPIPLLAQALEAAGAGLGVFVEIKSLAPQYDDRLLDALHHGPNPSGYAIHSFDHRIVRRLGAKRPDLRRGVLSSSYLARPLAALEDAGATILWQERTVVDAALVETVHQADCRLIVWTVDRPEEMRRLLALGGGGRGRHLHQLPRRRPPHGRCLLRVTEGPRVAVIGAGTMGHGIAYVAALAGCAVTLTDSRREALPEALRRIDSLLAGGIQRGKLTDGDRVAVHTRLRTEPTLGAALHDVEVVIEAVVEDLAVKQRLFAQIERAAPPRALLATNTSSLSVAAVAAQVSEPGRVIGMHFFNPVHVMKLVEIVPHARSDRAAVERALELARRLGKEPIVVKDSPGFASSRLGVVLGLEAMRLLEQGVASAEDIDKAMELGYNHPMGPLKLTDLVGLDVRLAIAEYLHRTLELPHYEPPKILRDKVARGELGKKTGKGFYTWSD